MSVQSNTLYTASHPVSPSMPDSRKKVNDEGDESQVIKQKVTESCLVASHHG